MTEARKARRLAGPGESGHRGRGDCSRPAARHYHRAPRVCHRGGQPAVTTESPRLPRPPEPGVLNSRDGRPMALS